MYTCGPADTVLTGPAAPATGLLPTSTKDSLLQTLVMAGSPWDGIAPLWGLELRRLAELGTEAVGTSAVTKRVMMQLEGACDVYMWGWEEEDWWRRLEMRPNMLAKSAGEEIWKAARLETQTQASLEEVRAQGLGKVGLGRGEELAYDPKPAGPMCPCQGSPGAGQQALLTPSRVSDLNRKLPGHLMTQTQESKGGFLSQGLRLAALRISRGCALVPDDDLLI
ncbi:MAG: hypothetical protein FRX49_04200 [Trebouxia sp. A1-2]|nr:MAG: hypothetical protein FRX49_04200 [Trebouxia sp. A1-2]